MRYLITGGAGFIGSHLAERLLEKGEHVVLLDNLSTGSMDNIRHLKDSDRLDYHLDGIENRIQPPDPIDRDLYEMEPEERHGINMTPGSLGEVLDSLEADHEFLLKGGVFTQDLIDTWIAWKRENDVDPLRLRPHPYEFALYYDC